MTAKEWSESDQLSVIAAPVSLPWRHRPQSRWTCRSVWTWCSGQICSAGSGGGGCCPPAARPRAWRRPSAAAPWPRSPRRWRSRPGRPSRCWSGHSGPPGSGSRTGWSPDTAFQTDQKMGHPCQCQSGNSDKGSLKDSMIIQRSLLNLYA